MSKEIKKIGIEFPTGYGYYKVDIDLSDPKNPQLSFFSEADYEAYPESPWVDGNSPHLGKSVVAVSYNDEEVFDDKHNIIESKILR